MKRKKTCKFAFIMPLYQYSVHAVALYFYPYYLSVLSRALACFFPTFFEIAVDEFTSDVNYGLATVVSVLFKNTRMRWPHNEREIFNTARGVAECSIENFEFSLAV